MKLSDFMTFIKNRIKLFLWAAAVAFVLMLCFTLFLNGISYEVTATLKIDSSILLSPGTQNMEGEKTFNRITLNTDKLDDKAAMEYVQSNKDFFNSAPMIDYNEVVTKVSERSFLNKTLNSVSFKRYLKDNSIMSHDVFITVAEQTDTLSVRVHGKSKTAVKNAYDDIIKVIPSYISDAVSAKLSETKKAVDSAVAADQAQADDVINEYMSLKFDTNFAKTSDYNKSLELLNKLSALSYSTNQNSALSNRLNNLLSNDISPDVVVKSEDTSGLKLTTTLVPYVIIEVIAALLLALLVVFVTALAKPKQLSSDK